MRRATKAGSALGEHGGTWGGWLSALAVLLLVATPWLGGRGLRLAKGRPAPPHPKIKKGNRGTPPGPRYGPAAPSLALWASEAGQGRRPRPTSPRNRRGNRGTPPRPRYGPAAPSLARPAPQPGVTGGHPRRPPVWACGPFTCSTRSSTRNRRGNRGTPPRPRYGPAAPSLAL
jgi:hypothetical protein